MQEHLERAVRHVIKERPEDPIAEIGKLLLALPKPGGGAGAKAAAPVDVSNADADDEEAEHKAFMEAELKRGDWASNRGAYDAVRMYYRWTFMPVSKDRRRPLSLIAARGVTDYRERDVYTFGVCTLPKLSRPSCSLPLGVVARIPCLPPSHANPERPRRVENALRRADTGASLKFWFEGFDALNIATGPHWGFDSFEGLPEEAAGMELECKAWLPGSFSAADQFGVYTFAEVEKKIKEHVGEKHAPQTSECASTVPALCQHRTYRTLTGDPRNAPQVPACAWYSHDPPHTPSRRLILPWPLPPPARARARTQSSSRASSRTRSHPLSRPSGR